MVALGFLAQDLLSGNGWNGTQIFGAQPTVTGTNLTVQINPGRIYSLVDLEATQWSSLPADLTDLIVKQGILLEITNLTGFAAPGTAGQSIDYLIEGQYQDFDTNFATLNYWNASNPEQPYSGAGNNGLAQPTTRQGLFALQVKAGTAATTGSQVAPTADSGWTPMYVVTVAYGQTVLSLGNISQAAGAPFNSGTIQMTTSGLATNLTVPIPYTLSACGLVMLNITGLASNTSNSTSFTLTGPVSSQINLPTGTPTQNIPLAYGLNNGAYVPAFATLTAGSNVITFSCNGSSSGWTASGNKGVAGNLVYSLFAGNPYF